MFPSVSPHALSPPAWDGAADGDAADGLELASRDPAMTSERHPFGLVRRVPSSAAQQVCWGRNALCPCLCVGSPCGALDCKGTAAEPVLCLLCAASWHQLRKEVV